jgi:AbrB family looped-hinge helix DNA binding protein
MRQKRRKMAKLQGFAEEGQAPLAPPSSPLHEAVELGAGGRVVIPAKMRAALGIKVGDRLNVRLEGNELRIYTYQEGLRRAQEIVKRFVPEGSNLADDLIAERRREAASELSTGRDD